MGPAFLERKHKKHIVYLLIRKKESGIEKRALGELTS